VKAGQRETKLVLRTLTSKLNMVLLDLIDSYDEIIYFSYTVDNVVTDMGFTRRGRSMLS